VQLSRNNSDAIIRPSHSVSPRSGESGPGLNEGEVVYPATPSRQEEQAETSNILETTTESGNKGLTGEKIKKYKKSKKLKLKVSPTQSSLISSAQIRPKSRVI